jgi:glutathione S-transferase
MEIVLHDNPRSSNAQKVRFLLGVLGLPYARREVPFGPDRPGWHRAVNPVGGIPAALVDGVAIAESNAILRLLAARAGREDLYPQAWPARARVEWILDAVTGLRELTRPIEESAFGLRRGRGLGAETPDADGGLAALDVQRPRLAAWTGLLEVAGGYALGGRLTLPDIAAAPFLHRLRRADLPLTGLDRLSAWADTVLAHPAWVAIVPETGV